MSIGLYMDVNVRAEITRQLRIREVDTLTSEEDGTRRFSDAQLLDRSTLVGRVLFTRDADLLVEAIMRQRNGITFAGVIYAHQPSVSIRQCIEELELIAKITDRHEWLGRVEYLPLK
jgi:predicted nuclease of predicted toxin-antitoxin system